MATRSPRGLGQYSGVARAVERIGERWTLLIVRDLLAGARRYSDLKAGLPRIPTNILSDRLRELQESGIVRRVPQVRGGYELTPLGRALEPVVVELERWGLRILGDPGDGEVMTADALAMALRAAFREEAAAALPPTEYVLHVGGVSVSAVVAGAELDVVPVGGGALPQPRRRIDLAATEVLELTIEPEAIGDLLTGGGRPALQSGGAPLLTRFRTTFRVDRPADPSADAAAA